VSVREKTKSSALRHVPESSFSSALRAVRAAISVLSQTSHDPHFGPPLSPHLKLLERDFAKSDCAAELHGLMDAFVVTRRRILTNDFLFGWMKWCAWILVGLIVAAAFIPKLTGALILAVILAVIGTAAMAVWTWRRRPSIYDAACRLDSAAVLHDRLSTAIYFGAMEHPEGMLRRQRQDATTRLARVDARGLFPIQLPATAGRALILFFVVAGLFVYRMYYKPPMIALMQTAARSQLVQSILSPLLRVMEKDVQRAIALVRSKPDSPADDVRPGEATASADGLWQSSDEKGANPEDGQSSQEANIADQQGQQPMPGDQAAAKDGDSQQQEDGDQQSQSDEKKSGQASKDSQQGSDSGNQSPSHSLMQALKNLLSNSAGQPMNNQASQQPPNGQGMPQSGNSHQPGAPNGDKKGDSRGSSDAKQKASQNSSNGAGSQQGNKDLLKDQATLPVNGVPDRVALESNGFKEQVRVRISTGTGTARLPVRDVSPTAVAVINGAEQENIPARYRLYVQRYFEHSDNNGQK
jgi:hypothetical protein